MPGAWLSLPISHQPAYSTCLLFIKPPSTLSQTLSCSLLPILSSPDSEAAEVLHHTTPPKQLPFPKDTPTCATSPLSSLMHLHQLPGPGKVTERTLSQTEKWCFPAAALLLACRVSWGQQSFSLLKHKNVHRGPVLSSLRSQMYTLACRNPLVQL